MPWAGRRPRTTRATTSTAHSERNEACCGKEDLLNNGNDIYLRRSLQALGYIAD
jgi:hypothetical protein